LSSASSAEAEQATGSTWEISHFAAFLFAKEVEQASKEITGVD